MIIAIGERSMGQPIEAMSTALASALEVEPVPFPGDHMAFETDPAGFAGALQRALAD